MDDELVAVIDSLSPKQRWQVKIDGCNRLLNIIDKSPDVLHTHFERAVGALLELFHDARLNVSEAAQQCLLQLYKAVLCQTDISQLIPILVEANGAQSRLVEAIYALSAVVFVHDVTRQVLVVVTPILTRAFHLPVTAVKRLGCVICENMIKLIDNEDDIKTFIPKLLPIVARIADEIADPECRSVASRVQRFMQTMLNKSFKNITTQSGEDVATDNVALCDCTFSLAYGAKILLNKTSLKLYKGMRYGVCGANGCGKSTLLKAIADDKVDGFPSTEELKRVYVEHDIDGDTSDINALAFVDGNDNALLSAGFTEALMHAKIRDLSGGWKMKLALVKAMASSPDLLLLDEPTNHLDRVNIEWLQEYLTRSHVSCLIVSHDSGFLDSVCTHIIYYQGLKLGTHVGNLASFVASHPEARVYYDMSTTEMIFKLPEPGFLDGIKTKDKAIVKMSGVAFSYQDKPSVFSNVNLSVTLNSRVACIGANGAGKSTLIKLLTGETLPTEGNVWRHPNLRIAYVAQHAFFHINEHLDKSANEYIRWRYASGEDRESSSKATRVLSPSEREALDQKLVVNGIKLKFECIIGRVKSKQSYEYNVQWMGGDTSYVSRDDLIDLGLEKFVNEYDMKEAAQMGMLSKPLTQANVEKHLADIGLSAETGTHSRIRGYSGGQKVRLVVGAATWMHPHVIVLDEPSNYLDRDSLGALSNALRDFGGGVVIISHNRDFLKVCGCNETWHVGEGKVVIESKHNRDSQKVQILQPACNELVDALGNVIDVKAPKKKHLSRKEKKSRAKLKKARRDRGEDVSDSSSDDL